jgi:hypothetical protein
MLCGADAATVLLSRTTWLKTSIRPGTADHVAPLTVMLVVDGDARDVAPRARQSGEQPGEFGEQVVRTGPPRSVDGLGHTAAGSQTQAEEGMGGRRGLQRGGHESSCQLPCGGGGE